MRLRSRRSLLGRLFVRLLGFVLGTHAGVALAQPTPPQVVYTPGPSGSVELWMLTGTLVTPDFSTQRICETAVGDEVCAILAVVTSTGGTTLGGFTPVSPDVRSNLVSSTKLRIVKLAAAEPDPGDIGLVRLGTLAVNGSPDSLMLDIESRWVRADGVLEALSPGPILLPEPSQWLMLVSGLGLLGILRRSRTRRSVRGMVLLIAAGALAVPRPGAAQLYLHPSSANPFTNAIGAGYQIETFSSYPNNGVSNGHDFGGFTWTHPSIASDIALKNSSLNPSGHTGTLLLLGTGLPGGYGSVSDPGDNDDIRLDFDPPVQAAGLAIGDNRLENLENVIFYGTDNSVLASVSYFNGFGDMIGGTTGSGSGGYIGYVSRPGEPLIARITVQEGQAIDDDISFDNVIWKERVELTADSFVPRPRLDTYTRFGPAELPVDAGDNLGVDVTAIGDLNDDGVVDLAVGAHGAGGASQRGSVALLFLERDGTHRRVQMIADGVGGLPADTIEDDDNFGRSVAPLGDFDGDGVLDLAVGTQPTSPGDVYLLFLEPDGTVRDFHRIDESDPGLASVLGPNDWFGTSLALLPDFDGNGTPELAVGAPQDDDAGSDAGAVYILFLDTDGSVLDKVKITEGSGGFTNVLDGSDHFGYSVEAIGDLNRDGYPDLAVGARRDDDAGSNVGAVYLLFLDENANVQPALTQKIVPAQYSITNQGLAYFLESGDEFGAGLAWIPTPLAATPGVLAVGAPLMDAINPLTLVNQGQGAIFFLALEPDGSVTPRNGVLRTVPAVGAVAPGLFTPANASEMTRLGIGMAHIGDLDGDGFPDLAAGANLADLSSQTDVGALYLMFLDGLDPTAFADAVTTTSGTVQSSASALGPPDGSGAYLGSTGGGTLTVQFVNNALRRGGDTRADLIVHRTHWYIPPPVTATSTWTVRVSANGKTYYNTAINNSVIADCLPNNSGCSSDQLLIDLDSAGVPDLEYRFVQIQQPEVCVEPLPPVSTNCVYKPKVDAVEAVENRNFVYDADYDGFPDGSDNCRFVPNPNQTDSDFDFVGDVCDNCPATNNADQYDGDGDGFGDLCDDGELVLRELLEATPTWELRYRCPGDSGVSVINAAIVLPPGATDVFFGGPSAATACEEPPTGVIPNPPVGYVPGDGCVGATELGAMVSPGNSGVLGPGLVTPFGVRSDTLYLTMRNLSGLCTANEEVSIGNLHYTASPGGVEEAPHFTSRGIETPGLGLPRIDNRVVSVLTDVGTIGLTLSPAEGESPGAETRWELCVEAQVELNRISIGFEAPAGTTTSELRWLDCNSAPDASLRRTCSAFPTQYSTRIATSCGSSACPSYTEGPDSTDPVPRLFVVLEGLEDSSEPPITKLNTANASTCLGQVELLGSPGEPPDLSINGIEVLATQPAILAAIDSEAPFGEPDEVSTLDMSLTSASGATSEDTDNDTVRDEDDNCPYYPNTSQINTGALLSSAPIDFIGDDCQCGDLDFDGRMLPGGPDLSILVDVLLGINTSPAVLNRASVVDGREANLRDAVVMQLGLDGKLPVFDQVCEDGVLPLP